MPVCVNMQDRREGGRCDFADASGRTQADADSSKEYEGKVGGEKHALLAVCHCNARFAL